MKTEIHLNYKKCTQNDHLEPCQKLILGIANIAIQIDQIAIQCNKGKIAWTWIPLSVLQSLQLLHFITIYSLRNSI